MDETRAMEQRWQKRWEEEGLYATDDHVDGKENLYHLVMFPYPSGNIHIGHWYNFAPADVIARFLRMRGYNVLSPIGFDAFGLPAENAALKRGVHPRAWTMDNIERMRDQLRSIGAMYDWSRAVVTADPAFYRWTQWVFLQLHHAGLVDRRKAPANWCPSCKTILANEQVVEGHCERCDTPVEQRDIAQWVFEITQYAQRLLDDLEGLDWPDRTLAAQRNWIGRSDGAVVAFSIPNSQLSIPVFTTRPDTLWGATYLVLAPEHPLLENDELATPNAEDVQDYIARARQKSERERLAGTDEKTGVDTGLKAVNPVNGEEIPIWVADYVLASYGTGAIMAVPAHDERDWEFASAHDLPVRHVIAPGDEHKDTKEKNGTAYTDDGKLVDSGDFTGMSSEEARSAITDWLEKKGVGKRDTQWRLRDWIVSRQRYWGCPIPIIHCADCGVVPVPEEDLPVELPDLDDFKPREDGRSPLARAEEWVQVDCPRCGGDAERETDTMDTFVDSSWYFLRYTDPHNDHAFAERENVEAWMPVDLYIGGAEHTVLHLLYARFVTKALYDQKLLSFDEPFTALRHQGIILGPDGQKMSKSRGNVVDPDAIVEQYGADAVRMYLCFMGPYDQGGSWDPQGIKGVVRFLRRVDTLVRDPHDEADDAVTTALQRTVKNVTDDVATLRFNTAIAAMMKFMNVAEDIGITQEQASVLLRLLAPFAPHHAEEWWREVLDHGESVHRASWPPFDPSVLEEREVEMPVQVDGTVRGTITVAVDASEKAVREAALAEENVQRHLEDNDVVDVVVVPETIVNVVTERKD